MTADAPSGIYYTYFSFGENRDDDLENIDGLKVLDAGCGPALWSARLAKRGAIVYGVDGNLSAILKAREFSAYFNTESNMFFSISDFERGLPFPDATFDLVICNHVVEHIENEDYFIHELLRMLKPNGKMKVSVPNRDGLNKIIKRKIGLPWMDIDHKREHTEKGFRNLLERNGIEIVSFHREGFEIFFHSTLVNWLGFILPIDLLFNCFGKIFPRFCHQFICVCRKR